VENMEGNGLDVTVLVFSERSGKKYEKPQSA
jgi:hypothetical protein